jgi:N-methylhydantoinase A
MAAATRAHATDRGVDHRGMPLFAFGGAGPVHACQVAELLQAPIVVFPPYASVLSAFGALVTPPRLDLVRGFLSPVDAIDWQEASKLISEMMQQAGSALRDAGCAEKDVRFTCGADLRYLGQQNELTVWLPHAPHSAADAELMLREFEKVYRAHYSVTLAGSPVEIVSWRVTAEGPLRAVVSVPDLPAKSAAMPRGKRSVYLWGEAQGVPVWDRASLGLDAKLYGPALIEERETTIVLAPGWQASVDPTGSLIATREASP